MTKKEQIKELKTRVAKLEQRLVELEQTLDTLWRSNYKLESVDGD